MANDPKTIIQITRKGMWIWGLLVFFIAAWMFVLGILVGRGTAPVNLAVSRLEQELAALKATRMKQQQSELEAQAEDLPAGGQADLGFYEALKDAKSNKDFKIPDPPPEKPTPSPRKPENGPAPATQAAKAETGADKPSASQPSAPAPAQTPGSSRAQPVAASRPVASEAPAPGQERYTIQVASLRDSDSAERMVDSLRKKGYAAYQIRTEVKDKGAWYRVRVGAFKERPAAEAMLKKLQQDKVKGLVVSTP